MSIWATMISFDGDEEDHLQPYAYQGSNVRPDWFEREGWLDVACVGDHVYDEPTPFLRVGVAAWGKDATVLLDREQVSLLRDRLEEWLDG